MRLVFMIERIKQQKALDKERRKIVKKKWQYLLPRFTRQQKTARSLENVVEYVELRDKRLEVSSVLEKLDEEVRNLHKAKTSQEKFQETMGRFVHIPLAYETQIDKLELLADLMADIREYRELLEPGMERDRFDYLWGLGEEAEEGEEEGDIVFTPHFSSDGGEDWGSFWEHVLDYAHAHLSLIHI